jgi:hypothetical protein
MAAPDVDRHIYEQIANKVRAAASGFEDRSGLRKGSVPQTEYFLSDRRHVDRDAIQNDRPLFWNVTCTLAAICPVTES